MDNNITVTITPMQKHFGNEKVENFSSYESAVTFFQEKCEDLLNFYPEISHTQRQHSHSFSEGGIGFDYRIELLA